MKPHERMSMAEIGGGKRRELTCPKCGKDAFAATSTWWAVGVNGSRMKRRSRRCRCCGYEDNETVPSPIRDADIATAGNSEHDFIDE